MNKDIYNSVLYIQWFVELVLLAVAIIAKIRRNAPLYLQNFFWYPVLLVGSLLVYYLTFFNFLDEVVFIILNNVLILFHFAFLGYTMLSILGISRTAIWLKAFYLLIIILLVPLLYKDFKAFPYASIPFAVSNLGLIVFSGYYFFKLFAEFKESDPLLLPSVWLALGIFIFGVFVIPGSLFDVYIEKKGSKEAYFLIYYVFQFAYFARHFCFLRAYYLVGKIKM